MIACVSPNGQNVCRGNEPPTRLLVATVKGVSVLERPSASAPWVDRGRTLDDHHMSSIMIEPKRGGVFAGAHSGGLYYSADGGMTWAPSMNGITIDHVFCVGYAHHGERIVLYAGTQPASMFRSDDYGKSWVEQPGVKETEGRDKWSFPSPPHDAHVKAMTIDEHDPNVIYAGVEQGDLLKTTDGGATWRVLDDYSKETDWTYRDIHQVVLHPKNSNEVYMSTGMGVYRSYDAGETWKLILDNGFRIGHPDHMFFSPFDDDTVFMSGAGANPGTWRKTKRAEGTVVKSTDRLKTAVEASNGLPDEGRINIESMGLTSYPGGFTLFVGTTDGEVYASDDQAAHWTRIASGLAPISKIHHYRNLQLA
jgi:photosystem II stability/assembly factor-like uncharacterized protein